MKVLFIFSIALSAQALFATFNLDVRASSQQNSQTQTTPSKQPASTQASDTNNSFSFSNIMSPKEMQQTGVDQLSSSQRQALATWIQTYAAAHSQQSSKPAANAVVSVVGDGHYVKLGNGSVWNINPNAWLYSYYWKQGDTISVSKSQDTLFPYTLTNSSYNQPVTAQKASDKVTQNLTNAYTITAIKNSGQFVRLSNSSLWQVAPSARYQAAGWSEGDTIYVVENKVATGGGYELFNGTTSRSVQANVVKNASALKNNSVNNAVSGNNSSQKSPDTYANQSSS